MFLQLLFSTIFESVRIHSCPPWKFPSSVLKCWGSYSRKRNRHFACSVAPDSVTRGKILLDNMELMHSACLSLQWTPQLNITSPGVSFNEFIMSFMREVRWGYSQLPLNAMSTVLQNLVVLFCSKKWVNLWTLVLQRTEVSFPYCGPPSSFVLQLISS